VAKHKRHWLSPPELLQYCIRSHMPVSYAKEDLYEFVLSGGIRARRNGRLLTLEETRALFDTSPLEPSASALIAAEYVQDQLRLLLWNPDPRGPTDSTKVSITTIEAIRGWDSLPADIELLVDDWDRSGHPRHWRRLWDYNHPPEMTAPSTRKKTGPKPKKKEAAKEAMRNHIRQKQLTPDGLKAMPDKELVGTYGAIAGRTMLREARDAVVSEFQTPTKNK
jgi:hypothetical protein